MLELNGVLNKPILSKGIVTNDVRADTRSISNIVSSAICELDATLANSYDGVAQTFSNIITMPSGVTTQKENDFWLGVSSSPDSDPTFTGDPGSPLSNFALDGSDRFTFKSNTAFLNSIHKTDEASLEFAFGIHFFWPASITTGTHHICGNSNSSSIHGFRFSYDRDASNFEFRQVDGSSYQTTNMGSGIDLAEGWHTVFFTMQKTSGTGGNYTLKVDSAAVVTGTLTTFNTTTTDPVLSFQISGVSGSSQFPAGSKIVRAFFGDGYLTDANMIDIRELWFSRQSLPFSLAKWNLMLPINTSGDLADGVPENINQDETITLDSYASEWFKRPSDSQTFVLNCPDGGASNVTFARTELRHFWGVYGSPGALGDIPWDTDTEMRSRFDAIGGTDATSESTVCLQIHDTSEPAMKLVYDTESAATGDGQLRFFYRETTGSAETKPVIKSGMTNGDITDIRVQRDVANSKLNVFLDGNVNGTTPDFAYTFTRILATADPYYYWKMGDYYQIKNGPPYDGTPLMSVTLYAGTWSDPQEI